MPIKPKASLRDLISEIEEKLAYLKEKLQDSNEPKIPTVDIVSGIQEVQKSLDSVWSDINHHLKEWFSQVSRPNSEKSDWNPDVPHPFADITDISSDGPVVPAMEIEDPQPISKPEPEPEPEPEPDGEDPTYDPSVDDSKETK